MGWGYDGWPYSRALFPFPIYPGGKDFGKQTFERVVNEFRPDVVIALGDLWMVDWIRSSPSRSQFQLWLYFTIDGRPLPREFQPVLRNADARIACAHYGREVVEEACPDLDVDVVYHGVDTSIFKPLSNREEIRSRGGLSGRFVVGCVARNQPRKLMPVLIRAFASFSRNKPESLLYLHTNPDDIGWDVRDLLMRHGIDRQTLLSRANAIDNGLTPEQLNEVYNAFDVFVLPSAAEGFGLPLVEAMAAGVPVIATDYSSCSELVGGRGELIRVLGLFTVGRLNIDHAIPDDADLVAKLELLYRDPARREQHRRNGLDFAATLDWDLVMCAWEHLFRDRIAGREQRGHSAATVD
jgi:glycosyltransferase involved in cell wall biosynthesis